MDILLLTRQMVVYNWLFELGVYQLVYVLVLVSSCSYVKVSVQHSHRWYLASHS